MEKAGAQFDKAISTTAKAHKQRKRHEADIERAKANELELQGQLAEIEASLKKAIDGVTLLREKLLI